MNKDDIRAIIDPILDREAEPFQRPSSADWQVLQRKLEIRFPKDFVAFIEIMCEYTFPGDLLNISESDNSNGNDTIEVVYDFEIKNGDWNPDLIPFYSIGNGDYFCLNAKEGETSKVYYYYHENGSVSMENESFVSWLKALPVFLNG